MTMRAGTLAAITIALLSCIACGRAQVSNIHVNGGRGVMGIVGVPTPWTYSDDGRTFKAYNAMGMRVRVNKRNPSEVFIGMLHADFECDQHYAVDLTTYRLRELSSVDWRAGEKLGRQLIGRTPPEPSFSPTGRRVFGRVPAATSSVAVVLSSDPSRDAGDGLRGMSSLLLPDYGKNFIDVYRVSSGERLASGQFDYRGRPAELTFSGSFWTDDESLFFLPLDIDGEHWFVVNAGAVTQGDKK